MLKQLAIILSMIVFIASIAMAQDKPEVKQKQESTAWNKVCPIDGMPISSKVATVEYNNHVYGFCSNEHAVQFKQDPEKYAGNLSDDGAKFIGEKEMQHEQQGKEGQG
jgi:YHS domain-containing protein